MVRIHDFTRKRQCYVANTFALFANHTISSCIGQREIELLFLAEIYGEKKGRGGDASRCWKARAIPRNFRWRHTVTNTRNLSIRCVWGEEIVAQRLLERLETHDRFTTQFICMLITSWWSFPTGWIFDTIFSVWAAHGLPGPELFTFLFALSLS